MLPRRRGMGHRLTPHHRCHQWAFSIREVLPMGDGEIAVRIRWGLLTPIGIQALDATRRWQNGSHSVVDAGRSPGIKRIPGPMTRPSVMGPHLRLDSPGSRIHAAGRVAAATAVPRKSCSRWRGCHCHRHHGVGGPRAGMHACLTIGDRDCGLGSIPGDPT